MAETQVQAPRVSYLAQSITSQPATARQQNLGYFLVFLLSEVCSHGRDMGEVQELLVWCFLNNSLPHPKVTGWLGRAAVPCQASPATSCPRAHTGWWGPLWHRCPQGCHPVPLSPPFPGAQHTSLTELHAKGPREMLFKRGRLYFSDRSKKESLPHHDCLPPASHLPQARCPLLTWPPHPLPKWPPQRRGALAP